MTPGTGRLKSQSGSAGKHGPAPAFVCPDTHLWDNHPTSKPNPGVGMLVASGSAPVTGTLVKANSKVGGTEGKKTPGDQLLSQHAPRSDTKADKNGSAASHQEEAAPPAPPPIAGPPTPWALEGILPAKAVLPGLSPPLSQGVS